MKLIRRELLELSYKNKLQHIGSCLSVADIMYVLFKHMNKDDQFILSKAHASLALKVVNKHLNKNIESKFLERTLGHGLSIACGMALADRSKQVYCICGDGELNEGQIWEAVQFASQENLNNLTLIVDHNKLQGLGYNRLVDIPRMFEGFGWDAFFCDGHNHDSLKWYLEREPHHCSPKVIIASTIKGKGISFLENKCESHYKLFSEEEYLRALKDIEHGWIELEYVSC